MGIKVRTFIRGRKGDHIRYFRLKWVGGETVIPLKMSSTEECVRHITDNFAYLLSIHEINRYRYLKLHDSM